MTNTCVQSRRRDYSNASTIDRLAFSRAQHLQSRENRPKSVSDDEIDAVSDWSDSDRECDLLSEFESVTNFHQDNRNRNYYNIPFDADIENNKFPQLNPPFLSRTIETPLGNINDSTTSTQVSFVMETDKPKHRFIKKQSISSIKHTQAPLLPARRIQTKQTSPYRSMNRKTTNAQVAYPLRNPKTPTRFCLPRDNTCTSNNINSRLGTESSLSTYSAFQVPDDNYSQRQITSPSFSQSSISRTYEMKKLFVDDCDYGRLVDTSGIRPSQPRGRQKWGTIVHPPFPLGYQHIAPEQVTQVVERLASPVRCRDRHIPVSSTSKRYLSVEETDALINRLTKVKTIRSSEQYSSIQRQTGTIKPLNNNTNNWKGSGIPA